MRFFFYGTLIDPDVRDAVLGDAAPPAECLEPASLAGWARRAVQGETFPIIVPAGHGRVDGVLARGIGVRGRDRLIGYEGRDYELVACDVALAGGRLRSALVFVPARGSPLTATSSGWSYATWRRLHKRRLLAEIAAAPPGPRP